MEAIVLAGGRGTRLAGIINDVPKPMADIGGKPFLAHLLSYLAFSGITRAILSVGYKHEQVENYFGANFAGMAIDYVVEEEPLGTGGALKAAMQFAQADNLFVLNGDTFFQIDMRQLMEQHLAEKCDITMALKHMDDAKRYGTVILRDKRIGSFREKLFQECGYINGGVYCFRKEVYLSTAKKRIFSLENDFLQREVQNLSVCPYIDNGYFIDIGIPDDYRRAVDELQKITAVYAEIS